MNEFTAPKYELFVTGRSQMRIVDYVLQTIEDDMVSARQEDRKLGSEDFSRSVIIYHDWYFVFFLYLLLVLITNYCRWLTMARLMAASFGETFLSMEHWQMVKEMERLRLERFK